MTYCLKITQNVPFDLFDRERESRTVLQVWKLLLLLLLGILRLYSRDSNCYTWQSLSPLSLPWQQLSHVTAIVTRDSNCHTFEVLKRFNDEFQTFLAKLINLSSSGRQDIVDLVKNAQSIEEVCQCFDRKLTSALLLQSCHRVLKQAEKVQFVHEVKKECLKILLKTTKTKENEVKFLMLLQTFLDEEFVAFKCSSFDKIPKRKMVKI